MNKRGFFSALAVATAAFTLASGAGLAQAAPVVPGTVTDSSGEVHGMGFDIAAARAHHAKTGNERASFESSPAIAAPDSYSLKDYALSPGNQGQVGSCVTWATGYSGYGILMNEAGRSGAPMAPMFIYSQIVKENNNGQDSGTFASVALPMEKSRGIDTQSDYSQGTTNYKTLPSAAQKKNALNYKLGSFTDLTNSDRQTAVKSAISQGHPVAVGFSVRDNFNDLDSNNSYYDPAQGNLIPNAGHEVTIIGYDADGVTVENSWGTNWGDGGFFTAPWSWVTGSDVDEVSSMNSLAAN